MTPPETTAELLHKLSKELPSKRALLIDRYPNARSSLRIMLASMGVTAVHNAGNSAEVLRQVKAHSFDIILSAYLLEDGRDPRTPARLAEVLTDLGWTVVLGEPTPKGTQLDVVVSEV